MFEAHNTCNTYDRIRANASTFRSNDPIMKSINNPYHDMDYHRTGISTPPPAVSSNGIFPRSASEAQFDTTSKFRQLPCRTFISVGTCPYRERCVYLHDPRCICKEAKTKTRRKNKEDVVLDSLFWPVMPYPMVAGKLDMNRQPHVIQSYAVPMPQYDQYHNHDAAVYSLWMHFVDFCIANNESSNNNHYMSTNTITADSDPCYRAPNEPVNAYTNQSRLQIFQYFASCHGCNVSADEILHASSVNMPINARHVQIPRVTHPTTAATSSSVPAPVMFKTPPLQDPIVSTQSHLYNQSGGAYTRMSELYEQHQQQQQGRGGSIPSSTQTSRHPSGGNYHPSRTQQYNPDLSTMHTPYIPQHQQQQQSNHTEQQHSVMGRFSPQPSSSIVTTQYAHSRQSPVTITMDRSPQHSDHALNPTAPVFTSSCTMKLSDTNSIKNGSITSPPTSMSVLNSMPQSNNNTTTQQQQQSAVEFLFETCDPWAGDSGITDDERDSGSSFNSEIIQDDINAIWKKPVHTLSTTSATSSTTSSSSNTKNCTEKRNNSFNMLNTAITAAVGVSAALGYAL